MYTNTNVPARGRKRFQLDLRNASQLVDQGVEVQGLRLISVDSGDEDGSFNCAIACADGDLLTTLTFLVSDASEYPSDHAFFCSSEDELPVYIRQIIESVHEDGSLSIQELLVRLLEKLAKRVRQKSDANHNDDESEAQDEEDQNAFDLDDEMGLLGASPGRNKVDRAQLQRDFNEVVAYGYRPGFVQLAVDDFAITVSLPVKSLVDTIPARALMAWDKRLLSRAQHLTLLVNLRGVHPVVQADATCTESAQFYGAFPQFRVGLTLGYKPTQEDVTEILRKYGLKEEYDSDPVNKVDQPILGDDDDALVDDPEEIEADQGQSFQSEQDSIGGFRPFSLSSSLESLLDSHFLCILQLRIQYDLGWAGAEKLLWELERSQQPVGDIMRLRGEDIRLVDIADKELTRTYNLPVDPFLGRNGADPLNIPLLAFSYLVRRLTLCPRYCLVCHQELQDDLDALKPYVCNNKLCTYQYYSLNRGPSLEYEICANPVIVDLLVSITYVAAYEGKLDAPLPIGMGLRVPCAAADAATRGSDGLHDFDMLNITQMRVSIHQLIDRLPPIADMKRYLERPRKGSRMKPKLQNMDKSIPEAAWLVLRWCIASCTAHLEELKDEDEQVKNIGPQWRQFRFSVGAPDAEARFRQAVKYAQAESQRAKEYPSLYAFHGSPFRNWHSIIRHGLWFKEVANGRAFGDGVYFAKEGSASASGYAKGSYSCWRNSATRAITCVALAEIVNLPERFVSTSPYFVVDKTEWIMCRYLMVYSGFVQNRSTYALGEPNINTIKDVEIMDPIPYVPLDPEHPLTLNSQTIKIPEPTHALEKILTERRREYIPLDYDEDDLKIFSDVSLPVQQGTYDSVSGRHAEVIADDWRHDRAWVEECMKYVIPPPTQSSTQATTSLQRELKSMLKEQKFAKTLKDLDLPIAKDLEKHGVNSLVFEIRFPAGFPHAPPFFRILKPRFLPFSQGGGGHVTFGGSMCMDLLTADGWLPSYSLSAVLIQIKLAISSLDPRPARLSPNWGTAYGMQEAFEGYKRAANTHGWKNVDRIAV